MSIYIAANSLPRFSITKPYDFGSKLPSFFTNYQPTQLSINRRRFVTYLLSPEDETTARNPGLRSDPPDEETKGFVLQQTMFLIKDPTASLRFYSVVLGMSLLKKYDYPDMKLSLYFMGYEDTSSAPTDPVERTEWLFGKRAIIELTHYWGTETDPNFQGYHTGNSEPLGFGHIGITVDDIHKACSRFEKFNVPFVKRIDEGKFKGIAFIKDPDGYWIELFDCKGVTDLARADTPKP
uniref:lactoylglutathione lyase-like n=1 Tax=Erigeron canadensis TaxID=72917 RepID=UPI001CB97A0F|nr:lactoylglutathione lyase-like [Erigeron canadensis]